MATEKLIGRANELKQLKEFAISKKAGFVYVRGRRRVGKSALLRKLQESLPHAFYFFGTPDSTTAGLLNEFAEQWDKFTGRPRLTDVKSLSWIKVFSEITDYIRQSQKNLVLIFDEIQWLAKSKSGCIGSIKQAWQDWEHLGIKVIICGSSNKFFLKKTGGEENILRGMKTRADIWIEPFSLSQVKKFYFPDWSNEEVALTYMMLGGIPYYLNRIEDPSQGFIHSINNAVFTKDAIFLEELDEVLRVEFNEHGLNTIKKILGSLGQDGKTQAEIKNTVGLPLTTVVHAVEKLYEYGLVFQKAPAHDKKQNEAGIRYFMKDFYLNFYFQVLLSYKTKIENNTNGLLFPEVFGKSKENYYIPNFSGKAFELLVRYILERKTPFHLGIHRLLLLKDHEYDVLDYWDKSTQIDLIVEHQKDRISRIIECKWVSPINHEGLKYFDEVLSKKYQSPQSYSIKHFLVISKAPSAQFIKKAKEKNVTAVGINSLF